MGVFHEQPPGEQQLADVPTGPQATITRLRVRFPAAFFFLAILRYLSVPVAVAGDCTVNDQTSPFSSLPKRSTVSTRQ